MKILLVTSAFVPESTGGTEWHVYHLAREFSTVHQVQVFCREGRADAADYEVRREDSHGFPVVRMNYMFRDADRFEMIYRNPRIDEVFRSICAEFQPDLVHIHHLTCLSTGIIDVVKDLGLPLVMTLHDFWMVCPRGQRIRDDLELCTQVDRTTCVSCLSRLWPHFFGEKNPSLSARLLGLARDGTRTLADYDDHMMRVLNRVDLLLTPSEFHRERMLEFPLPEARTESLWHGLDTFRLERQRDVDAPVRRIGFIGSVMPSKGVHLLVEAFTTLGVEGLELHIHGEAPNYHGDTTYPDRLRSLAGAHPGVVFHGRYEQSKLPEILASLDVLVVPSVWWETFCLTIHEGLLSGAIVVGADHGAMRESLGGGRDGLLFRANDAQDLKRVLLQVVNNRDTARRFRNRGAAVKPIAVNVREMSEKYAGVLQRLGRDPASARIETQEQFQPPETSRVKDDPRVTVFIPTWNGEEFLDEVLRNIYAQKVDFKFEVLVIDSGSKDHTLEILARYPLRLIQIPNWEFNHGLTRNRAVKEARGEIVVLLTQDAIPFNETWLSHLVSNFDDPEVAGAYCHQIPRARCNPFQRDRLKGWTYGEGAPEVKVCPSRVYYESLSPMEKYRLISFDDVASSVRKSVMTTIPFERRQFGEDVAWAKQAILAGWKIVMDPRAVVVHSHDNPIWYEFKRVYLDHQNLNDLVGMFLVPTLGDALKFTLSGTRHLARTIRDADLSPFERLRWWIRTPFYSLGQNMGQFLGAQSNRHKRRGFWGFLDRRLKKGV